jgi:endonuclease/exonuclease/phosphatase family metal-dependent hydrolase
MKALRYFFNGLVYAAFFINMGLLFVAVSAAYISPRFFWPPAVVTLFFKLFLVIHICFLVLLLLRRRKVLGLLAALMLLLSIPSMRKSYGLHFKAEAADTTHGIKLMTYNVHAFTWHEDTAVMAKILNIIRRQKPDILCMQEYYMHPKKHKRILNFLRREMKLNNYYEYVTDMLPGSNKVGMAIFSKYPFHNFSAIRFNASANGAFFADMEIGSDTVRLINAHFQSVSLSEREYALPGKKVDGDTLEVPRGRLIRISLNKLRQAFRKRSYQVQLVKNVADSSPYKVILCGDFNDVPTSYLYSQLTQDLEDTYLKTNGGTGATFAGNIPGLRIDYILADPEIEVFKTEIIEEKAGDHYPVICWIDKRR